MRGLQEKNGARKTFLVIKHNTICEESKTERAGFVPQEVRNPRTDETSVKYIKPYDSVEALISNIEYRDTHDQYEQRYTSWRIHLDAAGTPCVLEIPFQSRISTRFMKLAENIDFTRPVEFRAWRDTRNDSTAFYVGQRENEDDEKSVSVPQKYTRANPGDCPEPLERLGGKWDFSDQMEFLHDRMMTVVIPKLQAAIGITKEQENGYHPPIEDDSQPSVNALPEREELVKDIHNTCKSLNELGDSPKWNNTRLHQFVSEKYQVDDGLNSLSTPYLFELRTVLNKRLVDLGDVPF